MNMPVLTKTKQKRATNVALNYIFDSTIITVQEQALLVVQGLRVVRAQQVDPQH